MALFGNKKIQVPEIPNNPKLNNQNTQQFQNPQINEFPQNFQTQTKPQIPEPKPTLPERIPSIIQTKPIQNTQGQNIPQVTTELNTQRQQTFQNKEQPFFIRIDKFNETKENFDNINIKVGEIEQILENLEKIKEQEDKELEDWKQEVNEMKSYLDSIDKEIFSKI